MSSLEALEFGPSRPLDKTRPQVIEIYKVTRSRCPSNLTFSKEQSKWHSRRTRNRNVFTSSKLNFNSCSSIPDLLLNKLHCTKLQKTESSYAPPPFFLFSPLSSPPPFFVVTPFSPPPPLPSFFCFYPILHPPPTPFFVFTPFSRETNHKKIGITQCKVGDSSLYFYNYHYIEHVSGRLDLN